MSIGRRRLPAVLGEGAGEGAAAVETDGRGDLQDRLPSEVFREHSLACYVTDPTSLKLRHEIGIDIIAWECDYPHSDSIWPDAPEFVLAELVNAGADDEDIDKIMWRNACRFFGWDPFVTVPRERATVGALRASAADVDTSIRSRKEWARLYAERQADSRPAPGQPAPAI